MKETCMQNASEKARLLNPTNMSLLPWIARRWATSWRCCRSLGRCWAAFWEGRLACWLGSKWLGWLLPSEGAPWALLEATWSRSTAELKWTNRWSKWRSRRTKDSKAWMNDPTNRKQQWQLGNVGRGNVYAELCPATTALTSNEKAKYIWSVIHFRYSAYLFLTD